MCIYSGLYLCIEGKEDDAARVDELVWILLTKHYSTFESVCSTLKKNGCNHWASKLRDKSTVCDSHCILFSMHVSTEIDQTINYLHGYPDQKCT